MGYYENLKCGNCGHSFTGGYVMSNGLLKTYMGVPYIKCTKCNSVNKTSFKPYSTFHWIEKIYHWFSITFRATFIALFFGFMAAALVHKFVLSNEQFIGTYSLLIIFIVVVVLNLIAVRSELKEIKIVEQDYNDMT